MATLATKDSSPEVEQDRAGDDSTDRADTAAKVREITGKFGKVEETARTSTSIPIEKEYVSGPDTLSRLTSEVIDIRAELDVIIENTQTVNGYNAAFRQETTKRFTEVQNEQAANKIIVEKIKKGQLDISKQQKRLVEIVQRQEQQQAKSISETRAEVHAIRKEIQDATKSAIDAAMLPILGELRSLRVERDLDKAERKEKDTDIQKMIHTIDAEQRERSRDVEVIKAVTSRMEESTNSLVKKIDSIDQVVNSLKVDRSVVVIIAGALLYLAHPVITPRLERAAKALGLIEPEQTKKSQDTATGAGKQE